MTNYLLEKSRTVKPGQGERNFHVFYQLVQGAPTDERSRLCLLDSAEAYPSLASCTSVEGIDDQKEFNDTAKAMADVGALAASRRGEAPSRHRRASSTAAPRAGLLRAVFSR